MSTIYSLKGVIEDLLQLVEGPNSLTLGGASPKEIAVAILAEAITVRRGGAGGCDRVRKTSLRKDDK